MLRFRFWLAALLIWLSVLFNLERLHEPINIASFVYVLAGTLAVCIVVVPPMRKATLGALFALSLLILLGLKLMLGYGVVGESLTLTVTEATAILITVGLSHQIARHARRFEVTAADVATARWRTRPKSFEDGQSDMYRELRRARRFNRPLSVIALEPTSETLRLSVDRLIEEVRREMIQRYVEVRLAEALEHEVKDFDLIANYEGRFILMLPETVGNEAAELAQHIAEYVSEELGLQLRVGTAAFPADELTLTGLIDRAESEMAAPIHAEDIEPAAVPNVALSLSE